MIIQGSIQRLCPNFQWPLSLLTRGGDNNDDDSSSLLTTGSGMIYELDKFPRSAIGPISWLIARDRPLLRERGGRSSIKIDSSETNNYYYLYFWVEPTIQSRVWAEFSKLNIDPEAAAPPPAQAVS